MLTAPLGIGFWAVAARLYPAADVGRDAVLISALTTMSCACQLNLVDALLRFLPGVAPARRARTIAIAYGSSALAALVGGTAFVLLTPLASRRLHFISSDPLLGVAFVAALIALGVFVIEDAVLTSLRRARWVPFENSAFSVAKISLLAPLIAVGAHHGVFLAYFAPLVVIVVVINRLLWTHVLRLGEHAIQVAATTAAALRRPVLARFLAQDYVGYILSQAPAVLLPLVVLAHLGSRYNAYFAIPFTLVTTFDLLSYNATMSLTVEAAFDASRTVEFAKSLIRRFLPLQLPIAGLIVLAAPVLLLPFGPAYVNHGTPVLRWLAGASVFRTISYMFVALSRLGVRGKSIIFAQGLLATVSVVLAHVLIRPLGLPGVGLAWLIANATVALALAPGLVRLLRPMPAAAAESAP